MMRTSYDPGSDAFHVRVVPDAAPTADTDEIAPGAMKPAPRRQAWPNAGVGGRKRVGVWSE